MPGLGRPDTRSLRDQVHSTLEETAGNGRLTDTTDAVITVMANWLRQMHGRPYLASLADGTNTGRCDHRYGRVEVTDYEAVCIDCGASIHSRGGW